MAKKLRIKKQVYYIAGAIIVLIIAVFLGISYSTKLKNEREYKKTNEYKLLEHGYKKDEVDIILKELLDEDITFLLNNEVDSKYVMLTQEKYFIKKNFYEYISYMEKNINLDLSTIVRDINIHLDHKFYDLELDTDISKNTSMLVNKYYSLPSDYKPDDLVVVSQTYSWGDLGSKKLQKVAYDAFLEMWEGANSDGHYLMVNYAYNSYKDQEEAYNNYKKSRGQKFADSVAARPGASEHQTGLALDIFSKTNGNKNTFKDSEVATWLANKSYKYGFILRYPEGKENITGFTYEPWHFRYVGVDIATKIYEENITLEEYYAYYIEK